MHPEHTTTIRPSQEPVAPPCSHLEPPIEGPDALQAIQQRQVLARAHPKHPLPEYGKRSAPPKQAWFLPGLKRARESDSSLDILRAAEWVAVRRGMFWTCNDQTAIDALRSRCFDYDYIRRRRIETRPAWLETLCRDQWFVDDAPGFPTKGGFLRFITDLLHARRVGAIGAILSQADAGTLYGVTPRHWRRWMAHAEEMGMVRILQLWQKDPTNRRHRGHWRMCYMLGHAIVERAGVALYEGLDRTFANGRPMKAAAAAAAKRLRAKKKEADRERHDELWHEGCSSDVREKRSNPTSFSPDMMSGPTLQSRETGAFRPPVSPDGKIQIAEECPQAGMAPLASLARSNDEPTATIAPLTNSSDHGADRLDIIEVMSSPKTTFGEDTNMLLAKLMANLRGPLMAFLFFLVSTTLGCREIHHTHDETTGVASELPGATSVATSPTGTSSGSTGGSSSASGGGEGSGDGGVSAVSPDDKTPIDDDDGSDSEIPDDTWDDETSSESGATDPWEDDLLDDPCVFDCVTDERDAAYTWCDAQAWPDKSDRDYCLYLAKDAVLLRCGEDCACVAYCEE